MRIELDNVVGMDIILPKLVPNCTDYKKFTKGSIQFTHRSDLDLTFTDVELNCYDPFGDGFVITIDGNETILKETK